MAFLAVPAKKISLYLFCLISFGLLFGTVFGASLIVTTRNSSDSSPISGALVNVYDFNSGAMLGSGITNSSGIKVFTGMPGGSLLRITTEKSGYSSSASAYLSSNALNARMDANSQAVAQTLGALTVVVKDPNSMAAVPGAAVTLSNNDFSITSSTDDSGSAAFSLPIGAYTITTTKTGYSTSTKATSLTTGTKTETVYPSPAATQTVSAATDQNANLTILVKDSANSGALAGATVTAAKADGSYSRSSSTDGSGSAVFSAIPLGSYTITATKTGYDANTKTISLTVNATETLQLAATPVPQDTNASLKVSVQDSVSGAFIAGVTVTASKTGFSQGASTSSSGGTDYPADFASLPKGDYTLTAAKTGYTTNTKTIGLAANTTTTISLAQIPQDTHYIEVTVYDDQGAAVPGAKVGVFKAESPSKSVSTTLTDGSGKAMFSTLADADYLVVVSKTGYNSNQATTHSDTSISITIAMINLEEVYVSGVNFGNSRPKLVDFGGRKVYEIMGQKTGMLFFSIPVKVDVRVLVDPNTKKVIDIQAISWWAGLVALSK